MPRYHKWVEGKGIMDVSIMGWIPVVHYEGGYDDQADAVTLLNDICLFCTSCIEKAAFTCEELDQNQVKSDLQLSGRKGRSYTRH